MLKMRMTSTGDFWFVTNQVDTYVGKSLELYGEWSYGEILAMAEFVGPQDNVVEIGSNIGAHTAFIAKKLCPKGTVYAFEPRRLLFQNLCANIALNAIDNVYAFQHAIGSTTERIFEGEISVQSNANHGAYPLGAIEGTAEIIDIYPLDDMLDFIKPIALLKADVEGHEEQVLRGSSALIKRDRPVLYLENDRRDKSPSLIEYCWSLDYELYWHLVPLFRPDNFANTAQNIFENIYSFNMVGLPRESGKVFTQSAKIITSDALPGNAVAQ
jgi:FkbM family methyltransferase